MKVLILEDDSQRVKKFRQKLHRHELTITDQVSVAKEAIRLNDFDFIFLDHDLDNRQYVDSAEENTGYQLCRWLATDKEQMNREFGSIVIHSMNTIGAMNMYNALRENRTRDLQMTPFHILIENLEG